MKLQTIIIALAMFCLTVASPQAQSPNAASEAASRQYDLVVIGGTPGGIACAVRAARQGLRVLLVNHTQHLGGFSTSGLGVADTQYDNGYTGGRSPLFGEWSRGVLDYYRTKYGADSPQYKAAHPGSRELAGARLKYESRVAEQVYDEMVKAEKSVTVLKGYHPVAVERAGRVIQAVILAPEAGNERLRVAGRIFVDAMYEADLAALAGVPYRVGRESREEFNEPHAGRIFATTGFAPGNLGAYPSEGLGGTLNLRGFQAITQQIFAGSTGEGDHRIQSYQIRLTITRDPQLRRLPDKPASYNPADYGPTVERYGYSVGSPGQPNLKQAWNRNLIGGADEYPDGDWAKRRAIYERHRDFAVGLLWFLQNDPSVPEKDRLEAREWGLPKDEYADNGNVPYEMYVREARRIVGRRVFTEHDATLARGFRRTPINEDSIAIAEWFMDSHEVSLERMPGSDREGKILLTEITRPAQIPYRTLLPKDLDNLLVPVALSATHVGWGTIRLEPTWMHIGEAAGFAAALALKEQTLPGRISVTKLQRLLVENGVMLSFFNDFDMQTKAAWVPAVQYLATKGFFASYNAQADQPLTPDVAREWARTLGELMAGKSDTRKFNASERAQSLFAASASAQGEVPTEQFASLLAGALAYWNVKEADAIARGVGQLGLQRSAALKRGDACRLIYHLLKEAKD